jgi:hypothetical protein
MYNDNPTCTCHGCECQYCEAPCEVPCKAILACDSPVTECHIKESFEKRANDATCDRTE